MDSKRQGGVPSTPDFIPLQLNEEEQLPQPKQQQQQQQPQQRHKKRPKVSRKLPPDEDPENAKYYQHGPIASNRMVLYIAKHLRSLVWVKDSMRTLLEKYVASTGKDARETRRRQLNTQLLGVYGLREGRNHLNHLVDEMNLCMNADPWKQPLSEERRDKIDDAIRYIFSAYDHRDYRLMVQEYEQLQKENKLQALTYYKLGFPRMIYKPKPEKDSQQKPSTQQANKSASKKKNKESKVSESKPTPPSQPQAKPENTNLKSNTSTPTEVEEEREIDLQVQLQKLHAKKLLSDAGSEIIHNAATRFNVRVSITFESGENVLKIRGKSKSNDLCRQALMRYAKAKDEEEHPNITKIYPNGCPMTANKVAPYIAAHFKLLEKDSAPMKHLLYQWAKAAPENLLERRRTLNIQLFGVYGMWEGRNHINTLRNEVTLCRQADPPNSELSYGRLKIIKQAIRYIFTSYDHQNYYAVVKKFEELKRANQLQMVTFADLKPSIQYEKFLQTLSSALKPLQRGPSKAEKKLEKKKLALESEGRKEVNNMGQGRDVGEGVNRLPYENNSNDADFKTKSMFDEQRMNANQFDNSMNLSQGLNWGANSSNYQQQQQQQQQRHQYGNIVPDPFSQYENSSRYTERPNWLPNGSTYQQQQHNQFSYQNFNQSNNWLNDDQLRWATFDAAPGPSWVTNDTKQHQQHQQQYNYHNQQHSNDSSHRDQRQWASFNAAPKQDHFDYGRWGEKRAREEPDATSSFDLAQLAKKASTLRAKEQSQLERLQNLLR